MCKHLNHCPLIIKTPSVTAAIVVLTFMLAGCAMRPISTEIAVETPDKTTIETTVETSPTGIPPSTAPDQLERLVEELEIIIKSGDADALAPYVQHGLLTDKDVIRRKAQIVIDSYNNYIRPAGENHLIAADEPNSQNGDELLVRWEGGIDNSEQPSLAPRDLYVTVSQAGQLKIRLAYNDSLAVYLPAQSFTSNGITLTVDATYDETALIKFFGTGLNHRRGEPSTFEIDENQPMQEHFYGQNRILLFGVESQRETNFSGYIMTMDITEGSSILLDHQVAPGAGLQDILTIWPLMEDFYEPARTAGESGKITLAYQDVFYLLIKDEKLSAIHLQSFAD